MADGGGEFGRAQVVVLTRVVCQRPDRRVKIRANAGQPASKPLVIRAAVAPKFRSRIIKVLRLEGVVWLAWSKA